MCFHKQPLMEDFSPRSEQTKARHEGGRSIISVSSCRAVSDIVETAAIVMRRAGLGGGSHARGIVKRGKAAFSELQGPLIA